MDYVAQISVEVHGQNFWTGLNDIQNEGKAIRLHLSRCPVLITMVRLFVLKSYNHFVFEN